MERTRSRAPWYTCCPAWDSSLAGASFVCLTCTPGSELRTEGSQSVTEVVHGLRRSDTLMQAWAQDGGQADRGRKQWSPQLWATLQLSRVQA